MWTSIGSNPARRNAAAISIWPLTPCSRRIATRGRAPVTTLGASIRNVSSAVSPGASGDSRAACSSAAHAGSSRSRAMWWLTCDHRARSSPRPRRPRADRRGRSRCGRRTPRGRSHGRSRRPRSAGAHVIDVGGGDLDDRAELLAEQRRERVGGHRRGVELEAQARGERHLERGDTRPPSDRSWYAPSLRSATSACSSP